MKNIINISGSDKERIEKFYKENSFGKKHLANLDSGFVLLDNGSSNPKSSDDQKIVGLLIYKKSEFDSKFFSVPCIDVFEIILKDNINQDPKIKSENKTLKANIKNAKLLIEHLIKNTNAKFYHARMEIENIPSIIALEKEGFFSTSTDINLRWAITDLPIRDMDQQVSVCREKDVPVIAKISKNAYTTTRFHYDPHISDEKANQQKEVWITNCYHQKLAEEILVYRDPQTSTALGYIAVKRNPDDVGIIILIAVDSKAQKRGIATKLMDASSSWFKSKGCKEVIVGTQLSNFGALRLYQNTGFRLFSTTVSKHYWRTDDL
jgi:ribosomal protein S18 acetylase RimI-like enzyme